MFKALLSLVLFVLLHGSAQGQITVQLSTLPDIGDELAYQSIPTDTTLPKIDHQVFQTGASLTWDFSNLDAGIATSESYTGVSPGTVADSFPDTDLAIDFLGLQGFAKRNTTDISILGVAGDSIGGLPFSVVGRLSNPFVIRRAPFSFGDQFSTSASFSITTDAMALDTIEQFQELLSQLPGSTAIDSIRITMSINRSEHVDAWGMVTVPSGVSPCIKMTQTDAITTTIEVYAVTIVGRLWIDVGPFLPAEVREVLTINTTNHLYFGADNKAVIADFIMAPDSTVLAIRYIRDITSGFFDSPDFQNQVEIDVFPNPASDFVHLNLPSDISTRDLTLQLYNINGQMVAHQNISNTRMRLDVTKFDAGYYIVTIRDEGNVIFRRNLIISE